MATKKVTFTLPEELVAPFLRRIGPSRRSNFVAEAIAAKLRELDRILAETCEAANKDPETQAIQRQLAALPRTLTEAWDPKCSK
jgi:hypothetical protein